MSAGEGSAPMQRPQSLILLWGRNAIAAYLGISDRTLRRWEAKGCPVRRNPRVFAMLDELDAWLRRFPMGR